jgi:HEAT repeat protein
MRRRLFSTEKFFFSFLFSVAALVWAAPATTAAEAQDKSAESYRAAYNLILDRDYGKARLLLGDFILQYPQSPLIDSAHFWHCYALDKMERSPEEVFDCYNKFLILFPESEWADDAKATLSKQLAKSAKPEFKEIVKSIIGSDEREIVLTSLFALSKLGDENALLEIINLYDRSKSYKTKRDILLILSKIGSIESINCLCKIARKDPDTAMRYSAVNLLGTDPTMGGIQTIEEIVYKDVNQAIQKEAMLTLAYSKIPSSISLPLINKIAKTHPNSNIRKKALMALFSKAEESPITISAMKYMAYNDPDPDLQMVALTYLSHSLSEQQAIEALIKILETHSNNSTRKNALFTLFRLNKKLAMPILERTAFADSSYEMQTFVITILASGDIHLIDSFGYLIYESHHYLRIPGLIKIAVEHPDSRIRLKAISALGKKPYKKVAVALQNMAYEDPDKEVQSSALIALFAMEKRKGIRPLIEIAKNHPDNEISREVVKLLEQSDDRRAQRALKDIARRREESE